MAPAAGAPPPLPPVRPHNEVSAYGEDAFAIRSKAGTATPLPLPIAYLIMPIWLGAMHFSVGWLVASLYFLVAGGGAARAIAVLSLSVLATLSSCELGCFGKPPAFGYWLTNFIDRMCATWHPIEVVFEGRKEWKDDTPRLVAYEPHSLLPLGVIGFVTESALLPKGWGGKWFVCGTSAIFRVPILKHLWGWSQTRPVSKHVVADILTSGGTAVVCPGGVAECMYMTDGGATEVAYLKKRKGFVKLALEHGVPLVPAVCFGQTSTLDFAMPGPPLFSQKSVERFARFIGFVPLAFWGICGLPIPHRRPMRVVLGKPLSVPKGGPVDASSIDALHATYLAALSDLYRRHHAAAVSEWGCRAPRELRIV